MKYPFNVITARGGWDGRDLPAVRDHRGGLHGLVHPRVLCQVSLQSQQGETLDMFLSIIIGPRCTWGPIYGSRCH